MRGSVKWLRPTFSGCVDVARAQNPLLWSECISLLPSHIRACVSSVLEYSSHARLVYYLQLMDLCLMGVRQRVD